MEVQNGEENRSNIGTRLFDARCEADYEDIVENLGFQSSAFYKVALSIGLVSKLTEEAS